MLEPSLSLEYCADDPSKDLIDFDDDISPLRGSDTSNCPASASSSSGGPTSPSLDSGVSTMESICNRDFDLRPSAARRSSSLAEILLSEHNNNLPGGLDVVKLLQLKQTDNEDQHSNSSSLESLTSLNNHQGSQEPEDGCDSGSTSCSEDSFEMSSTCSLRDHRMSSDTSRRGGFIDRDHRETTCESFTSAGSDNEMCRSTSTLNDTDVEDHDRSMPVLFRPPPTSISMDSFMTKKQEDIRKSVAQELSSIETGLPQFDFDKLEMQLATAARERENHERRLLGEEARRRLAMQADYCVGPSPSIATRPAKSNLAVRLQTAMNLQVCYMNELSESSSSESSESESDDDEFIVPKSRSTPNFRADCKPGPSNENKGILTLRTQAKEGSKLEPQDRRKLLYAETKCVLDKAKQAAEKSLADYRSSKSRACGVPRQSRQLLSKLSLAEIERIHQNIQNAIDGKNLELVQLLIDRDTMHMEHDSLLVDIEDFSEHEAEAPAVNFSQLLQMQDGDIAPASKSSRATGVTYPGTAPTPLPTPTSPTKSFVVSALPKSLSSFFKLT